MAKQRSIEIDYLNVQIVTDPVEISYVYLGKPDDKFGKDKYKVTVVNPPQELVDKMLKIDNDYRKEHNLKPIKGEPAWLSDHGDDGKKICFKSSKQPPVVDARVKPMDANKVYSGSLVKLQIQPGWCSTGVYTGMVWYLQGVQVLKKGSGFGGTQFIVAEDYLDGADDSAEEAPFQVESGHDIDEEDVELDEEDLLV